MSKFIGNACVIGLIVLSALCTYSYGTQVKVRYICFHFQGHLEELVGAVLEGCPVRSGHRTHARRTDQVAVLHAGN